MRNITNIWERLAAGTSEVPEHPLGRFADESGIIHQGNLQELLTERFSGFLGNHITDGLLQEIQNQLKGLVFEIRASQYQMQTDHGARIENIQVASVAASRYKIDGAAESLVVYLQSLMFLFLDQYDQPVGDFVCTK